MMFKGILFLALLALAATTFSDGRCDEMSGSARERCLGELQIATREAQRAAPHKGPNPESAGAGATAPERDPAAR